MYQTPKCCNNPNVARMDHIKSVFDESGDWIGIPTINRYCLKCSTHFYGPEAGEVRQISSAEWDDRMAKVFEEQGLEKTGEMDVKSSRKFGSEKHKHEPYGRNDPYVSR